MCPTSSFIQSYIEEFEKIDSANHKRLLDLNISFWKDVEEKEYPLKETYQGDMMHDTSKYEIITFLHRSNDDLDNVFILAEFNHVTAQEYVFEHIEGTDIYHKTFVLPKNAQAQYRIIENDKLSGIFADAKFKDRFDSLVKHPDPLSKHIETIPDALGPGLNLSVALLREHSPHIRELLEPKEEGGQVTPHEVTSAILGYPRTIKVYTPPEYNLQKKYPCLIILDGSEFLKFGRLNVVLDNLILTKRIKPLIAIFVDAGIKDGQTKRYEEYPLNPDFANSIVNEVIPFINKRYPLSDNKDDYIISGSSYGGLAAIYTAFEFPDKIKHVLSLSGSVHYGTGEDHELLIKKIAFTEPKGVMFRLCVGKLEGEYHWNSPTWPNQLVSHRHLATILEMKGYDFIYHEFAGDHSFTSWLEPFFDGITEIFKF